MELLKAVLFGIVEGVTEWLPISSTGHLILLNEFITLNVSDEFRSMFDVVIQLGAILAVIVLFFHSSTRSLPGRRRGRKSRHGSCGSRSSPPSSPRASWACCLTTGWKPTSITPPWLPLR